MRRPHPKRVAAEHAHPLVRQFYALMRANWIGVTDLAERAGLHYVTLSKWRTKHTPNLAAFEAALNAMGCGLAIVNLESGKIIKPVPTLKATNAPHSTASRTEESRPT